MALEAVLMLMVVEAVLMVVGLVLVQIVHGARVCS
jgi:hypothetical protein